jgi:hypothetical protein
MRKSLRNRIVLFGSILLMGLAGCGPELSKEELGTVVFELPKIEGVDAPAEKSVDKPASDAAPAGKAASEAKDQPTEKESAKPQEPAAANPAAEQKDAAQPEQTATPKKDPAEPNPNPAEPAK